MLLRWLCVFAFGYLVQRLKSVICRKHVALPGGSAILFEKKQQTYIKDYLSKQEGYIISRREFFAISLLIGGNDGI